MNFVLSCNLITLIMSWLNYKNLLRYTRRTELESMHKLEHREIIIMRYVNIIGGDRLNCFELLIRIIKGLQFGSYYDVAL